MTGQTGSSAVQPEEGPFQLLVTAQEFKQYASTFAVSTYAFSSFELKTVQAGSFLS